MRLLPVSSGNHDEELFRPKGDGNQRIPVYAPEFFHQPFIFRISGRPFG